MGLGQGMWPSAAARMVERDQKAKDKRGGAPATLRDEMSMLDYPDELSRVDSIKKLLGDRFVSLEKIPQAVKKLENEMKEAAIALDFEKAAQMRDLIKRIKFLALEI